MFAGLKKEKRSAFIAYLTGGFPTLSGMDRAAQDLVRAGVDILEIGVPFSDPIADGPTIQFASQKALEGGATPDKILRWARGFRRKHHRRDREGAPGRDAVAGVPHLHSDGSSPALQAPELLARAQE